MLDRANRLQELLVLLASPGSRPSGFASIDESRWAAIWIQNLFGEDAVRPLATTLLSWELFDSKNDLALRLRRFTDPEIAENCKRRAIREAVWCLEQIPRSIPVLIDDLGSMDESLRASAACALGRLRATAAVEPLIDRLADPDKEVGAAVSSALKRITGKFFILGGSNPRKWREWWNKRKGSAAR